MGELGALLEAEGQFRAAAGGAAISTVMNFVASGRSQGYRWRGVRDLVDLLLQLDLDDEAGAPVWQVAEWCYAQLASMNADSATKVVARMRTTAELFAPETAALLRAPLVSATLEGMRRRDGPPPLVRGAVPASREAYIRARDGTVGETRAVVTLMWCATFRYSDVAAIRVGGVWTSGGTLHIELAATKTNAVGLPRGLELYPPELERDILRPWTATAPPTTRPFDRPPLFSVSYAEVLRELKRTAGPEYTPHSFRKGAVQHLLNKGVDLRDIPLLTLHRSLPGLLAYAGRPDTTTRATLQALSASLAAP